MGTSVLSKSFRLAAAAVGMAVIGSGLAGVPAQAGTGVQLRGVMVPTVASAPAVGDELEATPLPELSTERSTTVLLPSGEYEARIATTPINYLDEAGDWAPINAALVAPTDNSDAPAPSEGGVPVEEVAVENAGAAHTISIPQDAATTPLRVATDAEGVPGGEAWVTMAMDGLTGAPVVEESTATFDQVEGADAVQLQSTATGLKETIVLEQPPTPVEGAPLEYRYTIQSSAGISPRLTGGGVVEFVRDDTPGQPPVFTIPVGNMFDSAETITVKGQNSQGPAYTNDVAYDLAPVAAGGWEFTVTPNEAWLTDPARVYPVMIDPDIQLVTNNQARDCSLWQDQANSIRCGDQATHLHAGRVNSGQTRRRSVLYFNAFGNPSTNPNGRVIPASAEITHGNVELWLDPTQSINPTEAPYVLNRVSKPFTNGATWNSPDNRPSANPWGATIAGGGPTGPDSTANRLIGSEPSASRFFNIDSIARGWHAGTFPNNGLVLKQKNESVFSQIAFFSSSANNFTNRHPRLNIRYRDPELISPAAGERDFWEFEERELNDRMTAKINIGNGNLLLQNQDTTVAGRAGWDMSWMRYYNSVRHNTGGALGAGWSHGFGGDGSVQLDFPDNNATSRSKVRFWGPSGYRTVFNRDGSSNGYTREKPGIKAALDYQPNENRYKLEWFDESKYFFNSTGRLASTEDKNGNPLMMTYRSDGRLGSVTDTRNRVLFFTYKLDGAGANTGLIDTAEVRGPGPSGNPTGGQPLVRWKYEYEQPTGQIARLHSARVETYNENGALTPTADDENVNDGGNVDAETTYGYDSTGKLTSVTDARDSLTNFSYDANTPRVKKMTRVHGTESDPTATDPAKDSATTFTYFGRAFPNDGTTDCKEEGDNNASFRTHIDGERLPGDSEDITRYCIDDSGRVLRTTDARDKVRSSSWSDNSNVTSADMSGTGSGQTPYTYDYDDKDENATGSTSPEGAQTGADYDAMGSAHNPASVQGDDSGGEIDSWRYKYDDSDNLIRARSGIDPTAPEGERKLGITYEYCWTPDGQISRIMPGNGDGDPDNDGDATSSGTDNVNCSPGSQGDDTIHTYNGQGELTNVNRPAGGDQTFTYDALSRIAVATDGKGTKTAYCYDAMDRVTRAVHHPSGQDTVGCNESPPSGSQFATWDYDLAGNTTAMGNIATNSTSPAIPSKSFSYDRLNRLTKEEPQNPSDVTTYDYDPAGNVITVAVQSETNANLEPTRYSYNPVNKLLTLNDQRPGDQVVTFEYDDRDNRVKTIYPITNADGTANPNKLVHETNYDKDSNVTCMWSYRQTGGPTSGTTCDAVKDNSRLITYRGYDYDNEELPEGQQRTSTKYKQIDLGDRTTRFAYDAIKRLTKATTGSDNNPLREFTYTYSEHSNLTNMRVTASSTPGLTPTRLQMAYNDSDEICASVRQQDTAPNLDCVDSTTVPGQTTYLHDATGNMTSATGGGPQSPNGLGLSYNLPRQTTTITPPGGATSTTTGAQAYDGVEQDRRTSAGNTTMSYGYSGQVNAQNTAGANPSGQIFVRDPAGDLIAMLSRNPANPGTITDVDYYLLDDQKTVMATHDGRGNLAGNGFIRYLYEPYGQIIRSWTQGNAGVPNSDGNNPGDDSLNGNAPAPTADNNPFTYVSGYHDRATGLIKFGTRYYIPSLGTWTQRDPMNGSVSNPKSLNLYAYSRSNPINLTDSSGRDTLVDNLKGLGRKIDFLDVTSSIYEEDWNAVAGFGVSALASGFAATQCAPLAVAHPVLGGGACVVYSAAVGFVAGGLTEAGLNAIN